MTGAEHYSEAERMLNRGINRGFGCEPDPEQMAYLAAAQAHATLALAAAQSRVADFVDRLGLIAMHTVFAGWTEQQVAEAQAWVRSVTAPSEPGDGAQ